MRILKFLCIALITAILTGCNEPTTQDISPVIPPALASAPPSPLISPVASASPVMVVPSDAPLPVQATVSPTVSPDDGHRKRPLPTTTPVIIVVVASPVASLAPSPLPTHSPVPVPVATATPMLSPTPSPISTFAPTPVPTIAPTMIPTLKPTIAPSLSPTLAPIPTTAPVASSCSVGTFRAPNAYPAAGCIIYAPTSVWNTPLGSPTPDPKSATYMAYYVGAKFGVFTSLQFGYTNPANQYGHPIYFGQATDPVYTVTCSASWASCNFGTQTWHIPAYAIPAGGTDHHLSTVDQVSFDELDCWDANKPVNGKLAAGACNHGLLTGTGLVFGQTAAGYAQWAGIIRAQELIAGNIPHALFLVMPCTSNATPVFPSILRTTDTQCSGNQGIPYGARFRLNMSDAQIAALPVAQSHKTILTALARYGAYHGDTNGNNSMSLQVEADEMYTAAGYANPDCPAFAPCTPLSAYFNKNPGATWTGDRYNIDLSKDVDWLNVGQWLMPPPGNLGLSRRYRAVWPHKRIKAKLLLK